MTDLPPPPPDPSWDVPRPRPLAPRRPGMVTAAGVILLVAGALAVVGGLVLLNSHDVLDLPGVEGRDVAVVAAVIAFIVGGVDLIAGWLVLKLSAAGRVLGIGIAVIGILGGLAQLRDTGTPGLLSLFLYGFVLYGLIAYGFVFKARSAAR